jgi:hypothetical protein
MEVGQGRNWGCSAKEKKIYSIKTWDLRKRNKIKIQAVKINPSGSNEVWRDNWDM